VPDAGRRATIEHAVCNCIAFGSKNSGVGASQYRVKPVNHTRSQRYTKEIDDYFERHDFIGIGGAL